MIRIVLPPSRTVRDAIGDSVPVDHYTGTLYKALGAAGWSQAERRWAGEHLLIHDRDAGIVPALAWTPVELAALQAAGDVVVDARSKEYQRLVKAPADAWTLRVVSVADDGRRLAISHWNKHHKGVLAAALVADRPQLADVAALLAWSEGAGVRLERTGPRELDLVIGQGS